MRITWDYVAGFFDGEGCINIAKAREGQHGGSGSFAVTMVQATTRGRDLLDAMAEFLELHHIKSKVYRKREASSRRKEAFGIVIQGRESVRRFLKAIAFRLHMKKQLAEDAYRFITVFPPVHGLVGNTKHDHIPIQALLDDRAAGMTYREIGAKHGAGETYAWDRINRARRNANRAKRTADLSAME